MASCSPPTEDTLRTSRSYAQTTSPSSPLETGQSRTLLSHLRGRGDQKLTMAWYGFWLWSLGFRQLLQKEKRCWTSPRQDQRDIAHFLPGTCLTMHGKAKAPLTVTTAPCDRETTALVWSIIDSAHRTTWHISFILISQPGIIGVCIHHPLTLLCRHKTCPL